MERKQKCDGNDENPTKNAKCSRSRDVTVTCDKQRHKKKGKKTIAWSFLNNEKMLNSVVRFNLFGWIYLLLLTKKFPHFLKTFYKNIFYGIYFYLDIPTNS